MKKRWIYVLVLLFLCAIGFAQEIRVDYRCGDLGFESDRYIKPFLRIYNVGCQSIGLDNLTLRYYYTKEGTSFEDFNVDYAQIGGFRIIGSFKYGFLEISFRSAGRLYPGQSTGSIHLSMNKKDRSDYNESDDYSYGKIAEYIPWTNITSYYHGKLIWGNEPETPAVVTPTPTPSPTANPIAQEPGTAFLMPNVKKVLPGEKFVVECHVNTGNQILGAYSLGMAFDTRIIQFDTDIGMSGVTAGPDGFLSTVNPNIDVNYCYPVISGNDISGAGPGSDLHLLDLHFIALSEGIANIALMVRNMVDTSTNPIGMRAGSGADVIVTNEPASYEPGQAWFVPCIIDLDSGNKFVTEIHLNSGTQEVAAYDFEIQYKAGFIEPDISKGVNGVEAGPDGFVATANPENGVLKIAGYKVFSKSIGADLNFVRINWIAKNDGSTSIGVNSRLLIKQLTDSNYVTIGKPTGDDIWVTIRPPSISTP